MESIYVIREVAAQFERPVLLFSGGKDSIVMAHLAYKAFYPATIPFPFLHIDTGRLFPETYSLIDRTDIRYNVKMDVYFPKNEPVEAFVKQNGINGFYESIEKRKDCCKVRNIEPLLRALSTLDVWICGHRREQSVTRTGVQVVEWDEQTR